LGVQRALSRLQREQGKQKEQDRRVVVHLQLDEEPRRESVSCPKGVPNAERQLFY
jgi:hypothetical protein